MVSASPLLDSQSLGQSQAGVVFYTSAALYEGYPCCFDLASSCLL